MLDNLTCFAGEHKAVSLIYNLNLSLNQYKELLHNGFKLPLRNDVDVRKKTPFEEKFTTYQI